MNKAILSLFLLFLYVGECRLGSSMIPSSKTTQRSADGLPINPRVFTDTADGSGAFGKWILDEQRLPAYHYELDHVRDDRAKYENTEGLDRRDHWHQIGNDHITGLASNDGVVQLYLADRGGVILNKYDDLLDSPPSTFVGYIDAGLRYLLQLFGSESTENFNLIQDEFAVSGGFGYLNDGTNTWATAFRYGPKSALTERQFGMGYFKTKSLYQGINYVRNVYSPPGDDPVLLADVEISNQRSTAVDIDYYEYWDVNPHQLRIEWIRSGLVTPITNKIRSNINLAFNQTVSLQEEPLALRFHQEYIKGKLNPYDDLPKLDSMAVSV